MRRAIGVAGVLLLWPAVASGEPQLAFQNAGGDLNHDELARVAGLTQKLAAHAADRLGPVGSTQLIVRVTVTPRVSQAICGTPPGIELDAATLRDYLAEQNPEYGEMEISFMFAHELGHLPTCSHGGRAEVEADKYARHLLVKAFGKKGEFFLSHPLATPARYAKQALEARVSHIASAEALVEWAGDCLRAEELEIRAGRVFSDFMNTKLAVAVDGRTGNRFYGELPINCPEYLEALVRKYPQYYDPELEPLQRHGFELNALLLEYFDKREQDQRVQQVSSYELWRGAAKGWAVPAVAFEGSGADLSLAGWRLSYMFLRLISQFVNPSMRIGFRELRLLNASEGTQAGEVVARTFGLEGINLFLFPVSSKLALGFVASLGWEMDVQRRAPWHRGRHRLVSGGELVLAFHLTQNISLLVGAAARSPVWPEPGTGYSLVFPIEIGLHSAATSK